MNDERFDEESEIWAEEFDQTIDVVAIRHGLEAIAEKIASGAIGAAENFQGADVRISTVRSGNFSTWPTDYQEVSSEFAPQISWLFIELRDCFQSFLNYQNKYWFFGTLAQSTKVSVGAQIPAEHEDLLSSLEGPLRTAFTIQAALERSKLV